MAYKRHTFSLTETNLRQIEYVLPKLKYSSYVREVISWLENFEESEAIQALDFLFYLEFITSPELQSRLEEQLYLIELKFGDSAKYVFCSYAEYPKSNDVILYLLAKSDCIEQLIPETMLQSIPV